MSYLPLPINVLIYPSDPEIGINSYISAENNVVTIVVSQQLSDATGDIAVTIDLEGRVQLF